jgi:hypothetical protein
LVYYPENHLSPFLNRATTLPIFHISCTFASSFEALLLNILVSGFAKPDLSSFSAFSLASSVPTINTPTPKVELQN